MKKDATKDETKAVTKAVTKALAKAVAKAVPKGNSAGDKKTRKRQIEELAADDVVAPVDEEEGLLIQKI